MRRALTIAVAALATVLASGCFHIKYTNSLPPAPAPSYDEWHHDFIFGLVEVTNPVNVSQACPNGFSQVAHEQSFVNGLVSAITLSIWTPLTVAVTCGGAKAAGPQTPAATPVASAQSASP
jgi:hypothetical protein